jgi:dephospho-CoA kinase
VLNFMVEFIEANRSNKLIILEVPLLFELNWQKYCDKIIVVNAPYEIQKKRVLARDGMTEDKFNKILALQIPEDEKLKKADFILDTSKDIVALRQEILRIIKEV